jgi:hypothetical protein
MKSWRILGWLGVLTDFAYLPAGQGRAEIVFTRLESSRWTRPKPVSFGRPDELDVCPSPSADGKYFFFSSDRGGNMDVYWVDAKILAELKKRIPADFP